jgi:hypothetical protein
MHFVSEGSRHAHAEYADVHAIDAAHPVAHELNVVEAFSGCRLKYLEGARTCDLKKKDPTGEVLPGSIVSCPSGECGHGHLCHLYVTTASSAKQWYDANLR